MIRKDNGMSFVYWKESIEHELKQKGINVPKEGNDLIGQLYYKNWTARQIVEIFLNPVTKGRITIEIEDQSGSQLSKDFYSFDGIREFLIKNPAARIYFGKKATFK